MTSSWFWLGLAVGLALAALALVVIYVILAAQRRRRAAIRGYLDLIEDLGPEQRRQVEQIRVGFLPRVGALRQALREERALLARLLFDEPASRPGVDLVLAQILDHQAELERLVIEHILEEKELLSPAQRRRFFEIIVQQFSSGGLGVHDARR